MLLQLWNDFAQPLKLQEAMLLILHASDHRDPALVLQLWTEALTKGALFPSDTTDDDDQLLSGCSTGRPDRVQLATARRRVREGDAPCAPVPLVRDRVPAL